VLGVTIGDKERAVPGAPPGLRGPAEGRALGCRGGEFVRSRFDWAPVADVFADICASAVERHAAGTP